MKYKKAEKALLHSLIRSLIEGGVALLVPIFFLFAFLGNPWNEVKLIKKGITTTGYITNVVEYDFLNREEVKDDTAHRFFYQSFTVCFRLPNGKEIEIKEHKGTGRVFPKYSSLTKPYTIEIEYLPSNPHINRLKGSGNKTIAEWFWPYIALGGLIILLFFTVDIIYIYVSFKTYFKEKRNLRSGTRR
ncbi:MAG: hypothetical protein V1733_06950 [bacterium]